MTSPNGGGGSVSKIKSPKNHDPPGFGEGWACYRRKQDKGHARQAYRGALKKTDADTILAGVQRFCEQTRDTDPQYIPLFATWLNGERWADEETKPNGHDRSVSLPRPREDIERESEMRRLFAGVFEESNPGQ